MKELSFVIYGLIVGHWLLNVHRRLLLPDSRRFVVVGQHCTKDGFIKVGACASEDRANMVADYLEAESNSYMGIVYDTHHPDDRAELASMHFAPVDPMDEMVVNIAGGLCGNGL